MTKSTTQSRVNGPRTVPKGITMSPIETFFEAVRSAMDVFQALQSLSVVFDEWQKDGMRKILRFAERHMKSIVAGAELDTEGVEKTRRLADNVARNLEDQFSKFMNESFDKFDKAIEPIRTTAPAIIVRDGEKIKGLQASLRDLLACEEGDYDQIVDAYKAMTAYCNSALKEAEAEIEAARKRQRKERMESTASALLKEIQSVSIDD